MKPFRYTLYIVLAWMLTACTGKKVYDVYHHTPIAGWEKNDTLTFDIPPVQAGGIYQSNLGLRINGAYPFMGLTLIVQQTIHPSMKSQTDTIHCKLIDENGNTNGQGICYYQYNYHITDLHLQQGDSIHVSIRHDMKREILPGIADIGIQLSAYEITPRINPQKDKQQ